MAKVNFVMCPNPVLTEPTMYVPLGVLYLGAVLQEAGHEVKIVDLRTKHIDLSLIPKADFYCFSCTTGEIDDAAYISQCLKKWGHSTTIVGGPHASVMPEECEDVFDVVVVGEGEQAILNVVDEGLVGLVYGEPVNDLDALPFPARHLLPEEVVFTRTLFLGSRGGMGPKSTPVISSRGCPFDCYFCAQPHRKIRFRSPECFVSEIKYLQHRYDCHHFRFVDDSFSAKKKRVLKICELLEPLRIHYRAQTRSDLLDEEICKAMKKSGCDELGVGVEVADDEILKLVNKSETVEDHKRAIRLMKEAGIRAKAYFMVGLPGYTEETIKKNMEFVEETQIDRYTVSIFVPYPGCLIAENPEKFGVKLLNQNYSHYWNFPEYPLHELEGVAQRKIYEWYCRFNEWIRSEVWRR